MRTKNRTKPDGLESLPNVGPAIAAKLRLLGFRSAEELIGQDPYALYHRLNELTGKRHDPCLLDVFLSVASFCDGNPAKPWWEFTAQRKTALHGRQVPPRGVEPLSSD